MKVTVDSEKELVEMTTELLHILVNLRHWTKLWNENYGGYYLQQKKSWEKRSDDYLQKIGMQKSQQTNEINIEKTY